MTWFVGFIGAMMAYDAFDAKHFGARQEWQVVVGLLFLVGAVLAEWLIGDDR